MRVICVLTLADALPEVEGDYIGVDRGALFLAEKQIHMRCAIGDFDSIEKENLQLIQQYADQLVCLNPIKDDSDSEAALAYAIDNGYDEIWFAGATGGRMDHALVNLKMAEHHPNLVKLYDSQNLIYCLQKGNYTIPKKQYPYISFFTPDTAVISLHGFKYSLSHRMITKEDSFTLSNEIVEEAGQVDVEEGILMVMQCKDAEK